MSESGSATEVWLTIVMVAWLVAFGLMLRTSIEDIRDDWRDARVSCFHCGYVLPQGTTCCPHCDGGAS